MERLDKVLANARIGSRKEVKQLIKEGRITVDDVLAKDPGQKLDPAVSRVRLDGQRLDLDKYIYLVMHKPKGVISATEDLYEQTVIDLLPEIYQRFEPFPVGRLDKDTTGLLLLTNDGDFNHRMISPRWEVEKEYLAILEAPVGQAEVTAFAEGIRLEDDSLCKPARLLPEEEGARVILTEGKFHQVKRMFEAVGNKVLDLKRLRMGNLYLPEDVKEGQVRALKDQEKDALFGLVAQKEAD